VSPPPQRELIKHHQITRTEEGQSKRKSRGTEQTQEDIDLKSLSDIHSSHVYGSCVEHRPGVSVTFCDANLTPAKFT